MGEDDRRSDGPEDFTDTTGGPDLPADSAGTRRRRGRRWVIVAAVALVLLPLAWSSLRVEIARWYAAAAQEHFIEGDSNAALNSIDRAFGWCDTRPEIWAFRARVKLGLKDLDGALQDCNQAIELSPDGSETALLTRMNVYQQMGRHDEALEDADAIVKLAMDLGRTRRVRAVGLRPLAIHEALNARAYACALANQNIESALDDINNAMARVEPEEVVNYLDTRGYLLYLDGDYEAAKKDMERAVELAEQRQQELPELPEEQKTVERRLLDRQERETLAVLYHHRGLVYKALGETEQGEADLTLADELGYSPEDGVW